MKKNEELTVDGKLISDWTEDQGWIEIGSWKFDPKTLSLKQINDTIDWEIKNAKVEVLEEIRPILIKAFELSEHAVVEHDTAVVVMSTDYKKMVNKAIDGLKELYPTSSGKLPGSTN